MTRLQIGMYVIGLVCLYGSAVLSGWIIIDSIAPNWTRIFAALRGDPLPPAASVAPATRKPHPRAVEAGARATRKVVR